MHSKLSLVARLTALSLVLIVSGASLAVAGPIAPGAGSGVSAQQKESVTVVSDVTRESDCTQRIVGDDGTDFERVCPAGSVIRTMAMSARIATNQSSNDDVLVQMSGDADRDQVEVDAAIASFQKPFEPQATCTPGNWRIYKSFVASDAGQGYRVFSVLRYRVRSDCVINNSSDRAKTNLAGDNRIEWVRSCMDGPNRRCTSRGFRRILATYTNFLSINHVSNVGRYYSMVVDNIDDCNISGCARYVGNYQLRD